MSTMLKTAAMSLLSKTLQTFLSKYLSDVDVEGVDLPSVYDGSRWGVRLSNVKLREGVQLVERLPGSRRRKKTKQQQSRSKTKKMKNATAKQQETQTPKDVASSSNNISNKTLPGRSIPQQGYGDDYDEGQPHGFDFAQGFPPVFTRHI